MTWDIGDFSIAPTVGPWSMKNPKWEGGPSAGYQLCDRGFKGADMEFVTNFTRIEFRVVV